MWRERGRSVTLEGGKGYEHGGRQGKEEVCVEREGRVWKEGEECM